MNKLDKKLKRKFIQNVETSIQYDEMIENTIDRILNDDGLNFSVIKKKRRPRILKMVASFAVAILVMGSIGTLGILAYSALGGTIKGKPASEWFGIKFSDSYNDYVVEVEGESVAYNNTSVDLVSTMCDDGFTVLEFDVKLSKEDKEYLRVGERVYNDEAIEEMRERHKKELEELKERYKGVKVLEGELDEKDIDIAIENNEKEIEYVKKYINGIKLLLNPIKEDSVYGYNSNNFNLIIDNESDWVSGGSTYQSLEKISDYEYKIYQYYFLPEDKIKNKTEFNLKFEKLVLVNGTDMNKLPDDKISGRYGHVENIPNNVKYIELDGEIDVQVSKEKALEKTKYIDTTSQVISLEGGKQTQTIEKISVTPMQTLIKVKVKLDDVNINNVGRRSIILGYNVYDKNGDLLNAYITETKREITYSSGKKDEWSPGDIGTFYSFYGATMEITNYIALSNDEENIENLKIVPTHDNVEMESSFNVELKD